MIIFWILLGALIASSVWFLYFKFDAAGKMSTARWVGAAISVLWGSFTIAWIVSSLAEGEAQAAGMGLLMFGAILFGLIFLTIRIDGIKFKGFKSNSDKTNPVKS
ncbi:MAG: dehalogenase [Dehalobacter sp. 4CP]|uniref:dehalogenase n=1 Tax=Dehalobacter sp. CP TaxID=2594474 RepID=UPI0013CC1472|nr:dehalogenase [Dehalobacter sp. 4CP]